MHDLGHGGGLGGKPIHPIAHGDILDTVALARREEDAKARETEDGHDNAPPCQDTGFMERVHLGIGLEGNILPVSNPLDDMIAERAREQREQLQGRTGGKSEPTAKRMLNLLDANDGVSPEIKMAWMKEYHDALARDEQPTKPRTKQTARMSSGGRGAPQPTATAPTTPDRFHDSIIVKSLPAQ